MPEGDMPSAPAGGGNNSSDFVRKLYKMLEDPAYSEVVRWGDTGDSFVVLENEKFTKSILPKHFKHSNFASFVRQLNKYDFHKVRHNEENGQTQYGSSAWEFKHPEFRADRKDNLDSIRRKAPAPRKPPPTEDQYASGSGQLNMVSDALNATQQQVQHLQESYLEIFNANRLFVEEILHLQKVVKKHHQVQSELLNHIEKIERNGRQPTYGTNGGYMNDATGEASPGLRQARDILNNLTLDHSADPEIKRMSIAFQHQTQTGASPESATGSSHMMAPPPGQNTLNNTFFQDPFNNSHMVYPVGQTIGIDPFSTEHVNNIPYNRPLHENAMVPQDMANQSMQTPPGQAAQPGGIWGAKKPVVLLVEDDKTCSRIGTKFLSQYDCGVEVARDGLEAVNKVNAKSNYYDLIFMDIVMPQLDGVSATAMIREVQPAIPIIAMTSNINQSDLEMYFHWGMRDVLAKPFTKDGMIGKLRKHLEAFLRDPPATAPSDNMLDPMYSNGGVGQPPAPGYQAQGMGLGPLSATSSGPVTKFETTPIHSPATSTSWNSPSQMPQPSPTMPPDQGYMTAGSGASHMVLTPGGSQKPQQYQQSMMANMPQRQDAPPEKRQRMYAPQGNYQ